MNDFYTDPSGQNASTPSARETFSRLGLSLVLLIVGMTVAQYVIVFLLNFLGPRFTSAWWANWIVSIVPLYGIGLPLMYLALQKLPPAPHNARCNNGFISYEKPAFTFTDWTRVLFIGFGCMYIGRIVGTRCMSLLSDLAGYDYVDGLSAMVEESPFWMTMLGTCVIAPLGEEFIFRKLFIDRARRFGDLPAILLSGILFGLFHANLFQFFYASMLGILLAYVYTRTGNLWVCAAMHAVVNFMCGVAIPEMIDLLPTDPTAELTLFQILLSLAIAAWIYGTIVAAIVLVIKRNKWRVLSAAPDLRPAREVMRDAITAPAMLAEVILSVAIILVGLVLPVVEMYLLRMQ